MSPSRRRRRTRSAVDFEAEAVLRPKLLVDADGEEGKVVEVSDGRDLVHVHRIALRLIRSSLRRCTDQLLRLRRIGNDAASLRPCVRADADTGVISVSYKCSAMIWDDALVILNTVLQDIVDMAADGYLEGRAGRSATRRATTRTAATSVKVVFDVDKYACAFPVRWPVTAA